MFAPTSSRPPSLSTLKLRESAKLGLSSPQARRSSQSQAQASQRASQRHESLLRALEDDGNPQSSRRLQVTEAPCVPYSESEFLQLYRDLGCPAEHWARLRGCPFTRYLINKIFVLELSILDSCTADAVFKLLVNLPEYRVLRVSCANPALLKGKSAKPATSQPSTARTPRKTPRRKNPATPSISSHSLRNQISQLLPLAIANQADHLVHIEILGLSCFDNETWANIGKSLKKCDSLKRLYFRHCSFTAEQFEGICLSIGNLSLKSLAFQDCSLQAWAVRPLLRLIATQSEKRDILNWAANLRSATFKKQKYSLLVENGLTAIDLSQNRLGDVGIQELCDGLANDIWIQYIDIRNNNITQNGLQSIVQLYHDNPYLIKIQLTNQPQQNKSGENNNNPSSSGASTGANGIVPAIAMPSPNSNSSLGTTGLLEKIDPFLKRRSKKLHSIIQTQLSNPNSSAADENTRYLMPSLYLCIPIMKLFISESALKSSQNGNSTKLLDFSYKLRENPGNVVNFPQLRAQIEAEALEEQKIEEMEEEKRKIAGLVQNRGGKKSMKKSQSEVGLKGNSSSHSSAISEISSVSTRPSTAASGKNFSSSSSSSSAHGNSSLSHMNSLLEQMEYKLSSLQQELNHSHQQHSIHHHSASSALSSSSSSSSIAQASHSSPAIQQLSEENERLRQRIREYERNLTKRLEHSKIPTIAANTSSKGRKSMGNHSIQMPSVREIPATSSSSSSSPLRASGLSSSSSVSHNPEEMLDFVESQFSRLHSYLDILESDIQGKQEENTIRMKKQEENRLAEEKKRKERESAQRIQQERNRVIDSANEQEWAGEDDDEEEFSHTSPGRVLSGQDGISLQSRLEFADIRRDVRKRLEQLWNQTERQLNQS